MFDTRNEMKCWLKNIVKKRKKDKETTSTKDPLTGDKLYTSAYDLEKYGHDIAIAKARKNLENEKTQAAEELPAKTRAKASS